MIPLYPDQILERMPMWYRWATWLTEKVWGGRFLISTNGLEHGTRCLLQTLRHYRSVRT